MIQQKLVLHHALSQMKDFKKISSSTEFKFALANISPLMQNTKTLVLLPMKKEEEIKRVKSGV